MLCPPAAMPGRMEALPEHINSAASPTALGCEQNNVPTAPDIRGSLGSAALLTPTDRGQCLAAHD
jgi:hypothetical protein